MKGTSSGSRPSRRSTSTGSTAKAARSKVVPGGSASKSTKVNRVSDGRRLGEVLAEQIEDEILENRYPVGTVLGSEVELLKRYGVSRAIFREAVRIVDFHGVASMRRGPGGGLVVAEPNLDAVVRAVTLQLQHGRIPPQQLNETRVAIEQLCIDMAIDHMTPARRRRLQEHLDHEEELIREGPSQGLIKGRNPTHDFHIIVAEITGNPAIELFVRILGRLTGEYSVRHAEPVERMAADVHKAHARIAEAIIAGDRDAAKRRMRRHLDLVSQHLHG